MEIEKRIPVHIITGFLGSGKTTFLNQIIQGQKSERIMVIENEIGEVNIDSTLVVQEAIAVMGITAGCICCSLNEELYDVLAALADRRDDFDRLIVETTGIAEPESIAEIFLRNHGVEAVFDLQNVICLADAQFLEESLKDTDTARRQILGADVILLNKMDLLEKATTEAAELSEMLRGINPLARIYTGSFGAFPISEILSLHTTHDKGAEAQTRIVEQSHDYKHHDISTFCLTFDEDFKISELGYELTRLLALYRHQIYRVKGIVAYDGEPTKLVIQSVRNMVAFSDGTAWAEGEVRRSKIVFIGKDVGRAAIEKIFARCLVKPILPKVSAQNSLLRRPINPQKPIF